MNAKNIRVSRTLDTKECRDEWNCVEKMIEHESETELMWQEMQERLRELEAQG